MPSVRSAVGVRASCDPTSCDVSAQQLRLNGAVRDPCYQQKTIHLTCSKIIPTNERVCRVVVKSRSSRIVFLTNHDVFPLLLELLLTMWAHASTHIDPRWKLGRSSRTGATEPTIISDRSVWIWRRHTLVLDVFSWGRLKDIWRMGGPCDLKKYTEWVQGKPAG